MDGWNRMESHKPLTSHGLDRLGLITGQVGSARAGSLPLQGMALSQLTLQLAHSTYRLLSLDVLIL